MYAATFPRRRNIVSDRRQCRVSASERYILEFFLVPLVREYSTDISDVVSTRVVSDIGPTRFSTDAQSLQREKMVYSIACVKSFQLIDLSFRILGTCRIAGRYIVKKPYYEGGLRFLQKYNEYVSMGAEKNRGYADKIRKKKKNRRKKKNCCAGRVRRASSRIPKIQIRNRGFFCGRKFAKGSNEKRCYITTQPCYIFIEKQ